MATEPLARAILDAVTVDSTSAGIPMISNGRASIQFLCTGHTSGSGAFTVDVSNDGVTWTAYNRLTTNVTNTNAQTDTRVASVTLSSNTSAFVFIPDPVAFYRVNVDVTTDGVYSAFAYSI